MGYTILLNSSLRQGSKFELFLVCPDGEGVLHLTRTPPLRLIILMTNLLVNITIELMFAGTL